MREIADSDRIRRFMAHLGLEDDAEIRVYFTGGATAVLLDWRQSTIDVDILIVPENDRLLRAIPRLKEGLRISGWGGLHRPRWLRGCAELWSGFEAI